MDETPSSTIPPSDQEAPRYIIVSILILLGGVLGAATITYYRNANSEADVAEQRRAVHEAAQQRYAYESAYGTTETYSLPAGQTSEGNTIALSLTKNIEVRAGDTVESSDGQTRFKIVSVSAASGSVYMFATFRTVVNEPVSVSMSDPYTTPTEGSGISVRIQNIKDDMATLSFRPWLE